MILVGPPNAGAAEALLELTQGRKFAPLLPFYYAAVLGTFPSICQLLPRDRHHPLLIDAASALLDERAGGAYRPHVDTPIAFRQVLFLPGEHLELTRDAVFRDNLLFWLLEDKRWRD